MALLSITASGQWWSTSNGWFVPARADYPFGRNGNMTISVNGALTNGTVIVVQSRKRAVVNGGTPDTAVPVLVIDAAFIAAKGRTGFRDDITGLNSSFEYDIGCPTTFGSGDTVSVELA